MGKYVLLTEVKSEVSGAEWWMEQTKSEVNIEIKDDFEDACKAMRNSICKLAADCEFFPFDGEHFGPFIEIDFDEDLDEMVSNIITDSEYYCDNPESLDYQDTEDLDEFFAFVAKPDQVVVDFCGVRLRFNVHNMKDRDKDYYFEFSESDDDTVINSISVRMFDTERAQSQMKSTTAIPGSGLISFGKYYQDKDGEEKTDLLWRILEKKDDRALVITDAVIDHVTYSGSEENNWEDSDIRCWLNTHFLINAFTDEEVEKIIDVDGDKLSLLTLDEYKKYFINSEDAKARYTDYSRKMAEEHYSDRIREPYAFWWLKTPNKNSSILGDGNVFVNHVCKDGTVNCFARASFEDAVRPTMWIKLG